MISQAKKISAAIKPLRIVNALRKNVPKNGLIAIDYDELFSRYIETQRK